MPAQRLTRHALQFRSDVITTTAAIRREFEEFERRASQSLPGNESGAIDRAFLFEKLAELRVAVAELGSQFQTHAELVEQNALPLPRAIRSGLRPFYGPPEG